MDFDVLPLRPGVLKRNGIRQLLSALPFFACASIAQDHMELVPARGSTSECPAGKSINQLVGINQRLSVSRLKCGSGIFVPVHLAACQGFLLKRAKPGGNLDDMVNRMPPPTQPAEHIPCKRTRSRADFDHVPATVGRTVFSQPVRNGFRKGAIHGWPCRKVSPASDGPDSRSIISKLRVIKRLLHPAVEAHSTAAFRAECPQERTALRRVAHLSRRFSASVSATVKSMQ